MRNRLLFFGVPLAMLCAAWASAAEHTKDSLDKVKQQVEEKKAVLVDVREPDEWNKGHVAGAVLVPLGELGKRSKDPAFAAELEKKLPKDKVIYCHCARGQRSLLAADVLTKMGYDVRALKPGYKELIEKGFPADEAKK